MSQLRIAVVCPVPFSRNGILGGGERYAEEFARALTEFASVDLITFGDASYAYVDEYGLRHVVLANARRRYPDPDPLAWKILSLLREYHMFFCHTINKTSLIIATYARIRRKKIFLIPHGGGGRTGIGRLGLFRLFHGFLLPSRYALVQYPWIRLSPYRVIYGGGDAASFRAVVPDFHRSRARRILYVGRITPHKGLHILVQAIPDDAELTVCGQVHDIEYARYIRELGRGRPIDLVTDASDHTLSELYMESSALVLPSVRRDHLGRRYTHPELLGLVVLEAMWHGTPVVATAVGGLPEIIDNGRDGFLVPPGDVDALRRCLRAILDQPQVLRSLSHNARSKIESSFRWYHVARMALAFAWPFETPRP